MFKLILCIISLFFIGCASNSKRDVDNSAVINQPMAKVKGVLETAYVDLGFQFEGFNEEQCAIGARPFKWGLLRGTGGETVHVCLRQEDNGVEVYCKTRYSFTNYLNQEDWDSRFLGKIKVLSSR